MRRFLWLGIWALAALALAPDANAAVKVQDVADALEKDPVYVAPSQRDAVPPSAARRLRHKIDDLARGRIQIAVIPQAHGELGSSRA